MTLPLSLLLTVLSWSGTSNATEPVRAPLPLAGAEMRDCNGNGIDDSVDIAVGASGDLDQNGVPDECQSETLGRPGGELHPGAERWGGGLARPLGRAAHPSPPRPGILTVGWTSERRPCETAATDVPDASRH